MELKEKHCEVLPNDAEPLSKELIYSYLQELPPDWEVKDNKILSKSFPFENFKLGMTFAMEVGLIAEKENHHPDVCIHYSNVEISLSTHSIGGLSYNDFIVASKIEEI